MAAITTQEFEHHFKSLYKPLCLFALRYTDQVDDAEDIVQQAFADVWDKNRAGNVIGNLKAYLYQAVRNRSLSFTSQPVNAEATEQLPDVKIPRKRKTSCDRSVTPACGTLSIGCLPNGRRFSCYPNGMA